MSDLSNNPLLQYMARLAPSSQQTMRYILQDAADRLGFVDCNIVDVPWHRLEPGHVIALVAALRADGYAPQQLVAVRQRDSRGDERGLAPGPDRS